MRKFTSVCAALLLAFSLAGCSGGASKNQPESTEAVLESDAAEETEKETAEEDKAELSETAIRVGSLKGPTSMGLVSLMNSDSSENTYDFTMVTAADELIASIAGNKLDIALIPANTASILYQKTEKKISVLDINTLGVLYMVSSDSGIQSMADLKGKTIFLTGKGTTPDYVLQYLLKENGLSDSDVTLEYKSEAAEVAAVLKETPDAIGLLPQPFATVAAAQNEALNIVLNLTEEWDKIQGEDGSRLVTGVTVVRNEFLEENPDAVTAFMEDHRASAEFANANPDETSEMIAAAGIIEKAPLAKKALPYCNITYMDGEEMKTALSGYLTVLFEQDPKSIGGAIPDDAFYFTK